MAGERFKERFSSAAVENFVTDAFALTGFFSNMDNEKASFVTSRVLSYDYANINPRLFANMLVGKVVEAANEMGFATKMITERDDRGRVLRQVGIARRGSRRAVIQIKEVSDDELWQTDYYSRFMVGGFMKRGAAEGKQGERFYKDVDEVVGRVIDKLFAAQGAEEIARLLRDSNPGYIQ